MTTDYLEQRRHYMNALAYVLLHAQADDYKLALLSPHMDPAELNELLQNRTAVSLPGVCVAGSYWRLSRTLDGDVVVRALRRNGSVSPDARHGQLAPVGVQADSYGTRAALEYGLSRWGGYLHEDGYSSAARIQLRNPNVRAPGGAVVATAYAWLKHSGLEILGNKESTWAAELAGSLTYLTTDPVKGQERIASNPEQYFYCSLCGHVLGMTGCRGCGRTFRRDLLRTDTIPIPMPRNLIAKFLERGHRFESDPGRWLKEA